jgi:hypothetical protein
MNSERSQPPALASWLLRRLCSTKDREALTGDLYERFGEGQSERWFWRQVVIAILVGAARGFSVRFFLILLMALNALVFFFGAILHSGVAIGPFHQPHIVPATVVEILCGLSLGWGVAALFKGPPSAGRSSPDGQSGCRGGRRPRCRRTSCPPTDRAGHCTRSSRHAGPHWRQPRDSLV